MKTRDIHATFNRGIVSKRGQARVDVRRVALSAEKQTNWMARTLGWMMLRPGLEYKGDAASQGYMIPFAYRTDDVAVIDLLAGSLRIWDNGDTHVSRASNGSSITNADFTSDLANWTDADDAGATSSWSSGKMQLVGSAGASARRRQEVTVAGADQGVEHALRIVVDQGSAVLRVGTTAGADDVFRQAVLRPGVHSIAFTPSANFWIEISSPLSYPVLIDSCDLESSGTLSLPTVWTTIADCANVRHWQIGDVIFCADGAHRQQRIERRANNSWSVTDYESTDGPYLDENTENITMTPSALTGDITLTCSQNYFQSGHVGAIFNISSQGQKVAESVSAENTFSDPIKVTGVDSGRRFIVSRTGTWVGTVSLQRSVGGVGNWVTVATYTGNATINADDGFDNSEIYYRIGIETGNYTSGTAELSLEYPVGSITGVVKVTGYTSATVVDAVVLDDLGGTDATEVWAEGAWSDVQGWPEAVALWEGRLWWSGIGRVYGSVSDAITNFSPTIEGDSAPLNRSAGDTVASRTNWLLPLRRLIVGTDGAENSIRSTSFDEPVTPSNYNIKAASTKGSSQVPAVVSDERGYFVGRSGEHVYEVKYRAETYGYASQDQNVLTPDLAEDNVFKRIAVQETPDRRIHCVREDGTAAILIRDPAEDLMCWVEVETDGEVQDVCILPGTPEDRVFYRVKRTIDGATNYYLEEWARERKCRGGNDSRLADCHMAATQASSATISGLSHLEGKEVVVWADGKDLGEYTVSSGAITVSEAVQTFCVGLKYTADFKSAKLAGETQMGLALNQKSRINKIGLVLQNTHYQGLKYGSSFDYLDDLPLVEDGAETAADTVWESFDEEMIEFPGDWDVDNRICLRAEAPRPCSVLAAVINVDRQDTP